MKTQPSFTANGGYDLTTPEKRLAAAEAMLRNIAMIPQAYHSRGPDFCRDEMRRAAEDGASQLADAAQPSPPTLQAVLGSLADSEAVAVWHALSQWAENEICRDDVEEESSNPALGVCERLTAVMAIGLAGPPPPPPQESNRFGAAGGNRQLAELITAVELAGVGVVGLPNQEEIRLALARYEATGDHNHGRGPINPGAPCPGGDCYVDKARKLLSPQFERRTISPVSHWCAPCGSWHHEALRCRAPFACIEVRSAAGKLEGVYPANALDAATDFARQLASKFGERFNVYSRSNVHDDNDGSIIATAAPTPAGGES